MEHDFKSYVYLGFAFFFLFFSILYAIRRMKGKELHGKKDLYEQDKKWFKEVGTTTFYENKEDCKCYDCLTSESKNCYANCLHPARFEYNKLPCMSCEFRSWCYTKYE